MNLPTQRQWKWAGIIALAVLVVIVIFQNTESVKTRVLWVTFEMPRVVLLFLTLAVGIILGVLGARYYKR